MQRRKNLTFEEVVAAASSLKAEGITVTNRAVHDLIGGGSLTTINSMLHQWHDQQADAAKLGENSLSKVFMGALVSEIVRHSDQKNEALTERVQLGLKNSEEAHWELAQAEKKILKFLNAVEVMKKERQRKNIEHQMAVARLEERLLSATARITSLENDKRELEGEKALAIEKLSMANQRLAELQKRVDDLERIQLEAKEENSLLIADLESTREQKIQAVAKLEAQELVLEEQKVRLAQQEKRLQAYDQGVQDCLSQMQVDQSRAMERQLMDDGAAE